MHKVRNAHSLHCTSSRFTRGALEQLKLLHRREPLVESRSRAADGRVEVPVEELNAVVVKAIKEDPNAAAERLSVLDIVISRTGPWGEL